MNFKLRDFKKFLYIYIISFSLIFIQCKITKKKVGTPKIGILSYSFTEESLGIYPKFIPKEEILKLNFLEGKYYTVYYSKGLEERAKYAYEILNKGDSIIKEITGFDELEKTKYNFILLDTFGNFYTDLDLPNSFILTRDFVSDYGEFKRNLFSDSVGFKGKIFFIFHKKVEGILYDHYLEEKELKTRFIVEGVSELIKWELMALFWPERFYYLSEKIADLFGKDTTNKIYDLSDWKTMKISKKETKTLKLKIKAKPEELTNLLPTLIDTLLPIVMRKVKQEREEPKLYFVAPYFWAKIIDKSKNPNLVKDFLKELRKSKDRSQKGIIKILERLTKLNIKEELKISSQEIYNNICKYWYFIKLPLDKKDLPTIEELKKEKDRKIFLTNIAQ